MVNEETEEQVPENEEDTAEAMEDQELEENLNEEETEETAPEPESAEEEDCRDSCCDMEKGSCVYHRPVHNQYCASLSAGKIFQEYDSCDKLYRHSCLYHRKPFCLRQTGYDAGYSFFDNSALFQHI